MATIAACLKARIGNRTARIQSVIGDSVEMLSDNFSVDQIVIATLLQYYFKINDTELFSLMPTKEQYSEWIGTVDVNGFDKAIVSFEDSSVRATLKSLYADTPAPMDWGMTMSETIDSLRLNTLSQFVYENQPLNQNVYVYYNWYSLTIQRCTQAELDTLSVDGNSYIDMFDWLRDVIVSGTNTSLEGKNYRKALYDESSDTIVFNSNLCIEAY